jgi:adenine phosphoribosyltransferase
MNRPELPTFKKSLEASVIVRMGRYEYFVNPITDGIPAVEPRLLEEVVEGIVSVANLDCDLLVAPEAMGIPLLVALSLRTGKPFNVIRKRRYALPGEVRVDQATGYARGEMYIEGIDPGTRVVLIDDVLSTGGTLRGVVRGLREAGAVIVDVVVAVEKGSISEELAHELDVSIKTLVRVKVDQGQLRVLT